jgi:hypothetical protein
MAKPNGSSDGGIEEIGNSRELGPFHRLNDIFERDPDRMLVWAKIEQQSERREGERVNCETVLPSV